MSASRLSKRHRLIIYGSTTALWLTGAAWLFAHYFLRDPNNFAAIIHPAEPWSIKLHGAVAMLFIAVVGSLAIIHMRLGWRRHQNRASAVVLLSFISALVMSGYLLYYGNENLREWSGMIHWLGGLALPLVLWAHIWIGRKHRTNAGVSRF